MKLTEIICEIHPLEIVGDTNREVAGVEIDSRKIDKDMLFAAIRGTQVDGHQFISRAIEKGATTVLCEQLPETLADGVTYLRVDSTERAIGPVATAFYGKPSTHVKLVGVTGTNGKTTIATLLYNMFRAMGHHCGLLSTVCNYIDGEAIPTTHTTPDAIELNRLLGSMVARGCE